jgi:hypothetical protein
MHGIKCTGLFKYKIPAALICFPLLMLAGDILFPALFPTGIPNSGLSQNIHDEYCVVILDILSPSTTGSSFILILNNPVTKGILAKFRGLMVFVL